MIEPEEIQKLKAILCPPDITSEVSEEDLLNWAIAFVEKRVKTAEPIPVWQNHPN